MSKGWESKSVEEQQSLHEADPATPSAASDPAEAERQRRRADLELQRERILSERTSHPHRRSALENALADVEEKLAEFGWSIHLNP